MEQARKNNRNIYTAFIYYKKAYDSVPYLWFFKIRKIYKINLELINFLSLVMTFWRTILNSSINNTVEVLYSDVAYNDKLLITTESSRIGWIRISGNEVEVEVVYNVVGYNDQVAFNVLLSSGSVRI
jgi:hypothetical protein